MTESSSKTRIAIASEFPLLRYGGTEVLVAELVRGLSQHYEIVLVTRDPDCVALGSEFNAIICDHLTWDLSTASPESARALAQALLDRGVKLAHFHAGGGYGWQSHKSWQSPIYQAAELGLPCVVTTHLVQPYLLGFADPDRPAWQRALLFPKAWLSKTRLQKRIKAEIMVSRHDQATLRRAYPVFARRIRQMYHSKFVADNNVSSAEARSKTILCVGLFSERKAQATLTEAFATLAPHHPDWKLVLMGPDQGGDYLKKVRSLVERLDVGGQVQILPAADAKPLLKSSAIYAMPSLLEGLPLSLQEALYYGCACVGSKAGGITELLQDDDTGLLIPTGDADALAAALDRLMSDPDLRARLGRRGRESVIEKRMLATLMVEGHNRLYEGILAGEDLERLALA